MSTPYEKGRLACAMGANYGANPYPPSADCRSWNEGWKVESEQQAEREKAESADQRLRDVVTAIEAFIDAKLSSNSCGPNKLNVPETREIMAERLAEWLAEK